MRLCFWCGFIWQCCWDTEVLSMSGTERRVWRLHVMLDNNSSTWMFSCRWLWCSQTHVLKWMESHASYSMFLSDCSLAYSHTSEPCLNTCVCLNLCVSTRVCVCLCVCVCLITQTNNSRSIWLMRCWAGMFPNTLSPQCERVCGANVAKSGMCVSTFSLDCHAAHEMPFGDFWSWKPRWDARWANGWGWARRRERHRGWTFTFRAHTVVLLQGLLRGAVHIGYRRVMCWNLKTDRQITLKIWEIIIKGSQE